MTTADYLEIISHYHLQQLPTQGMPGQDSGMLVFSEASNAKDKSANDWENLLQEIQKKISVTRFRNFDSQNMFSSIAMLSLSPNHDSGIFIAASFIAEIFGFYYYSKNGKPDQPIKNYINNVFFDNASYIPYNTMQAETRDAVSLLTKAYFPSYHCFDNSCASAIVPQVYHDSTLENIEMFQAIFGRILVAEIL